LDPDTNKPAQRVPSHLAIIMDGNGRWATRHGRARYAGHHAGVKAARTVVELCAEAGIGALTLFAFSSENWKRPAEEVNSLMRLFVQVLQREVESLHDNEIQLRFIGARQNLPTVLQKRMEDAEAKTSGNKRMKLVLAVDYGGRWDIVQAVRRVAEKVRRGDLAAAEVDESVLRRHMASADLEEPDLLIRTGGEQRLSNFLLWDLAYTEIFFSEALWPAFAEKDLQEALHFFEQRQRRFGRTSEQIEAVVD